MLRNLFSRDAASRCRSDLDIVLVHVAPTESAAIFRDELQALAAAGRIRLVERYDDAHGLLDVADLDDLVPDLAERLTLRVRPGRPARRARGAPRRRAASR